MVNDRGTGRTIGRNGSAMAAKITLGEIGVIPCWFSNRNSRLQPEAESEQKYKAKPHCFHGAGEIPRAAHQAGGPDGSTPAGGVVVAWSAGIGADPNSAASENAASTRERGEVLMKTKGSG